MSIKNRTQVSCNFGIKISKQAKHYQNTKQMVLVSFEMQNWLHVLPIVHSHALCSDTEESSVSPKSSERSEWDSTQQKLALHSSFYRPETTSI